MPHFTIKIKLSQFLLRFKSSRFTLVKPICIREAQSKQSANGFSSSKKPSNGYERQKMVLKNVITKKRIKTEVICGPCLYNIGRRREKFQCDTTEVQL